MVAPGEHVDVEAIVRQLRWLERTRGPDDLLSQEGRELARMLGLDVDPASISAGIDQVIDSMPPDAYRDAARELIGSGPHRWDALKTRHARAGGAFGVGGDAFRRRRAHGRPSRESETLAHVARSIATRSASTDPTSTTDHGQWSALRRRRRWTWLATAVVMSAMLVVGMLIPRWSTVRFDRSSSDERGSVPDRSPTVASPAVGDPPRTGAAGGEEVSPPPAATTPGSSSERAPGSSVAVLPPACPYAPGDPGDEPTGVIEDGVVNLIADEFELQRLAPRCAVDHVRQLGDGPIAFQEFGVPGETPTAAIIATSGGHVLTLPFAAWGSYRQIGGRSGDNAYLIAGLPVGLSETAQAAYVDLDTGVRLVAEERDAPYFFVLVPAIQFWDERGGVSGEMGRPTSNPQIIDGNVRQEFEFGWLEAFAQTGELRWTPVASPADDMPPLDHARNRIIRQADGTSWFITEGLRRKWIPDGLTFECLGGWGEVVSAETPGYAIAQLEYAGLATCDDSLVGGIDVWAYCAGLLGEGAAGEGDEETGTWSCMRPDGTRVPADLQDACDQQFDDERDLVWWRDGDLAGWRCVKPDWQPNPTTS